MTFSAKPTKLESGTWGATVAGPCRVGDQITITTRSGTWWTTTIASIVSRSRGMAICTIVGYGVTHFGRTRRDHNIDIFANSGERETCLENITDVYPIDSQFSCAYEHSGGIVLSRKDAENLGLSIDED